MAGGKKYGVYVKKGARGKVRARAAVNKINKEAGTKVAKVVTRRKNADAVVGLKKPKNIVNKGANAEMSGGRVDRVDVSRRYAKQTSKPGIDKFYGTMNRNTIVHEVTHGLGFNHRSKKASKREPFNTMSDPVVGSSLDKKQVEKVKKRKAAGNYAKPAPKPTGATRGEAHTRKKRAATKAKSSTSKQQR